MANVDVGHHCIVLGENAGADIGNETYIFELNLVGIGLLRTTMTPAEHEVMRAVVVRLIEENGLAGGPEGFPFPKT